MNHERFSAIVKSAEDAFWESVAKSCPEATTGDLDPEVARGLHSAAMVSIEAWILANAIKLPLERQRVRARHDLERYPHFIVPAGSVGTVVESSNGLVVYFDDKIPGCEEWDNKVMWSESEDLLRLSDEIEVLTDDVMLALLRACPRCSSPTLADDGDRRVLCECCNLWFDVLTKMQCDPPAANVDAALTLAEMAQTYHAACLAIGMGAERPRDMDEATLVSARDKLRAALEAAGYFRKSA